jgi:hypothetical protein
VKRPVSKRDPPRQTLTVSVSTVSACMEAVCPPGALSAHANSLTIRGELTAARIRKRPIILSVRRSGMPAGGRIYSQNRVLNSWLNVPPASFSDVLTLAMSGELSIIELTTEKLRHDEGEVFGARFTTAELRNACIAAITKAPSSCRAPTKLKAPRVPKGRHR